MAMVSCAPPPEPCPTRLADPNRSPGRDTIYILYCTGTLVDLFFLRAVPVPVGIQTISVITKIIFTYTKRTTTGVVSIKIYTHIQSLIYLYMYNFYYKTSEIAEAALVSTYL